MPNELSEFSWTFNSPVVSWFFCGQRIVKEYAYPLMSANVLRDGTGVAVVEPYKVPGSSEPNRKNAVIFNADGTERVRLGFPIPETEVYWFNDFYYIGEELTAILLIPGHDWALVVDESTGKYLRRYETR